MNKVIAILCSDLHLRDTSPVSRNDDYIEAQKKKLLFIKDLQKDNKCPVLCAGDVFDKWKSSPFLESFAIKYLPELFTTVPGNHDLPYHSINMIDSSSLGILQHFGVKVLFNGNYLSSTQNFIYGFAYGELISQPEKSSIPRIAIIHKMIHKDRKIHTSIESTKAKNLLRNFDYDLILSGDNHQTFEVEYEGKVLINPGSMMRMDADQIDHKPCVYLLYEDFSYEKIFLPIEEDVFDTCVLENKKEKESMIKSFVEKINNNYEISIDFRRNLESSIIKNKINKNTTKEIWDAYDE